VKEEKDEVDGLFVLLEKGAEEGVVYSAGRLEY
jgi:hypothetical protein